MTLQVRTTVYPEAFLGLCTSKVRGLGFSGLSTVGVEDAGSNTAGFGWRPPQAHSE